MPRERKLQIVVKRGKIYARTTYVGLDGKRHAIWRAGRNGTEAKANLRKALSEHEGGIIHAKKTFRELAEWYSSRYLIEPEYHDGRLVKGKKSWRSEKYQLKAIVEYFGGYRLRSITHGELERYKQKRIGTITQQGRSRTIASVNRELMAIRAMLRKAQKEGWLLRAPFEEHDSLISMADERRRERTLSYDEEGRLLAGAAGHLRPILVCALATGMRLGEILKLAWQDVDLAGRQIRVQSMSTKRMVERYAPVTKPLQKELVSLKAVALPNAKTVFGIKSNVRRSFKAACRRAGIKHGGIDGLTIHCLRHTAGTRMVKQGMSLAEVARILGHADIKTTYRYISADSDVMDKARAALTFRPPSRVSQTED